MRRPQLPPTQHNLPEKTKASDNAGFVALESYKRDRLNLVERLNALGAQVDALRVRAVLDSDPLNVRVKAPLCTPLGVADVVPNHRGFSAIVTLCHDCLSFSYSSRVDS